MYPRPSGIVTLTTDFGQRDPYVGIVKGAVLRASPKVQVVDVTHGAPPQDVAAGAFLLWSLIGRFPSGTVHVGVVDPGVGTDRRLLAVAACDAYWLVPDNGMIGAVLARDDAHEVRVVDVEHLRLQPASATFHGRDVLAPAAAWLAAGRYGFSAMGTRVTDADARDLVFGGDRRVVHVDHYGNLISNVEADAIGAATAVQAGDWRADIHRTYGDVAEGERLAYIGAFGLLEVARRNGSAADETGLQVGSTIELLGP